MDLVVTDGHDGLLAALAALFPPTPRQRCLVHKPRKVMSRVPTREPQEVSADLTGIWKQETKAEALVKLAAFQAQYQKRSPEAVRSLREDEAHLLTFSDVPPVMHRCIRTTNAIESFVSPVRSRTDQIDTLTTETSCLTIVWAVMPDIRLPKIPVGYTPTHDGERSPTSQKGWFRRRSFAVALRFSQERSQDGFLGGGGALLSLYFCDQEWAALLRRFSWGIIATPQPFHNIWHGVQTPAQYMLATS